MLTNIDQSLVHVARYPDFLNQLSETFKYEEVFAIRNSQPIGPHSDPEKRQCSMSMPASSTD
jgi:hypothetical protein